MRPVILFAAAALWVVVVLSIGVGASSHDDLNCDTTDGTVLVSNPWTDMTSANPWADYAALCEAANSTSTTTTTILVIEPPYMGLFPKVSP